MTRDERAEFEGRPTNTVEATARYLDVGVNQTYQAVKRGEIASLKIGRRVLVKTKPLLATLGA